MRTATSTWRQWRQRRRLSDVERRPHTTLKLDGANGNIHVGGNGANGDVYLMSSDDCTTLKLDVANGNIHVGGDGANGDIRLHNVEGAVRLHLDGATGQVNTLGADCAEEFQVAGSAAPGTVMVIESEKCLRAATRPYDRRVAGVISGSGELRPGIVLGKALIAGPVAPLALTGRVNCKVDASFGSIEIGDLLTTSASAGHAMRADPAKAAGSVVGKALRAFAESKAEIPILVPMQ